MPVRELRDAGVARVIIVQRALWRRGEMGMQRAFVLPVSGGRAALPSDNKTGLNAVQRCMALKPNPSSGISPAANTKTGDHNGPRTKSRVDRSAEERVRRRGRRGRDPQPGPDRFGDGSPAWSAA